MNKKRNYNNKCNNPKIINLMINKTIHNTLFKINLKTYKINNNNYLKMNKLIIIKIGKVTHNKLS